MLTTAQLQEAMACWQRELFQVRRDRCTMHNRVAAASSNLERELQVR